jgi:hypothetical protein
LSKRSSCYQIHSYLRVLGRRPLGGPSIYVSRALRDSRDVCSSLLKAWRSQRDTSLS